MLLFLAFTISGCTSAPSDDPEAIAELRKLNDPFEKTNRFIFKFNQGLDATVIKPITGMYRGIFPELIRNSVHNFIKNMQLHFIL